MTDDSGQVFLAPSFNCHLSTVNCQLKKMYSKDELKNLKLEFWESFAAYCEVQPYLRGRKKIWILYDTKVKGVELKFDISRSGAYVILEVNHRSEEFRLEMYERLTW